VIGRAGWFDARVAKRARDRKTGEHAVAAVECAGVLYGVDMRADHQRLQARGRRAGVQRAEDVADAVDPDVEVRPAHPRSSSVSAMRVRPPSSRSAPISPSSAR
jgi:hypothetical protein